MNGHWSCICHMIKHFVDLYQASMKEKEKGVKTNFVNLYDDFANDPMNTTHLDVPNFFVNL